jgi:hypothetical protein
MQEDKARTPKSRTNALRSEDGRSTHKMRMSQHKGRNLKAKYATPASRGGRRRCRHG